MVYGLQISGKYLEIFSLGEMKECEAGKLHITEKPMKPRLCVPHHPERSGAYFQCHVPDESFVQSGNGKIP